eukprot:CAMPEP_0113422326 /NCGR_PEP_ID=MMETSP0013_2-20120614/28400_1 /TAXON_ID=2843 ORGANISM="Skeletonema costatum, Strain 1716" /NCGR_SAMPLE_ID=MMETSP0013_2 /ASSEMBLY_ACC=CAM_ASM_000158 /LENGTH=299 /DNA_ID=CAMNT_0000310061 /DNA_START=134 /DNA_END=1033 /DNA_ORIENTATION=+ /assembly_acc=CAM_ASM_000158
MTFTSLTTILLLPSSTLGFCAVTPPRIKDTKVAVEGKSTAPVIPPPLQSSSECDGSSNDVVTLSNYMRLPVEQYVLIEMPLGSSLTKIDNNEVYKGEEFELVVPEITFFNLTLQPVVLCTVQPMEDRVVIFSDNCYLRGSSFIEKTRLNERFDFRVRCTLTWYDEQNLVAADVLSEEDESDTEDTGRKNKFRFGNKEIIESDDETDCSSSSSSTITATTSIDVAVDVPRPFSSIPKFIVERTGNAAMKLSLKYIQANFVRNLANDYEKWSTDEEYRSYRASLLSKEEEVECVAESQSLV